jgi:hypothetical protein
MISFLLLPIALATVHNSQGFTPLASSGQWKSPGRRSSQSRSTLFDTEESSPWTTQEWTAPDLTGSLTSLASKAPKAKRFKPAEEPDLDSAGNARAVVNANGEVASKRISGIEIEFPGKKKLRASVKETGTDSMKNYIKTMCNHELLNKNEEIILAREIQILLKWEEEREQLELQLLR